VAARLGPTAFRSLSEAFQTADRSCYGRALAEGLEFRILGPLEARDGTREIGLGGAKQRSVLAMLLLEAGTVVSADRLIEELWGDDRPEDAQTALQQHVSRLRKQLEPHDVLVTRSPGYMVELGVAGLDLHRFEELFEQGREELDSGDAESAAASFRAALSLWRGRPLADLENERFATNAISRLEARRLEVLQARITADLACGRAGELVGELQALARAHPLDERLRAQLMLALYRAGRQADALDAYADARRALVDELGLEPGPELRRLQQAILAQDPSLDETPRRREADRPSRRRTALAAGIVALVGVLAAAALGAWAALGRGQDEALAPTTGGSYVAAVDPETGSIRGRISAGRTPAAIAASGGTIWVVDADAQTILQFAGDSRVVETFSTGATPLDVAAGRGSLWVVNGSPLEEAQFVGPVATSLARLDPTTRTERAEVELPHEGGDLSNLADNRLAIGKAAVWAVTPDYGVARIDASTGAMTAISRAVRAGAVAAGRAGVWALGVDGTAVLLDERTAKPIARVESPASSVTDIAVGADGAWVSSSTDGTLWRVGGGRTPSLGAVSLEPGIADLAATGDSVWITNALTGTLTHVDAETSTVVGTTALDGIPQAIAYDGETVWVAVAAGPESASTDEVAGVRPLPSNVCEPVISGRGDSDVLVVSDFPLQGGIRITATQMAQAIAFALRERNFRAGRFRVAYQSCDDSIARTGLFDEAKCAANARAYAESPDVVGVIGTLNSPCAVAALPTLNTVEDGPLGMVSPLNSFVGLTRTGPGVDPTLPAALYPTGRRNYVRVYPTDDLQGAALALLARERRNEKVFVLDDGEPGYGALMATGFETAARRLGLDVRGRESWDPQANDYAGLANRVARSGATAVFVGGLLDTNAARVVKDLRSRLGRSVDVMGPDGLTPLSLLVEQAGEAAIGTYVSLAGVVAERLPAGGARWVERFRRTQAGAEVEPSAVYAAQAAEVLLDAIARSDGTRTSVVDELFRTKVRGGLLGSFGFDDNGDITESPVTILRVRSGGTSKTIESTEGGVVARVVRPSSSLVAPGE
jgi:branched-chain amino acid transport system substrate-binding protein